MAAPPRATVKWAASADAALKGVRSDDQVALLLFCTLDQDKYVGGGNKAADEYSGKYGKCAAYTVLDDPTCCKALQDGGVAAFAKVSASPENAKEWARFNAQSAGIILCTASGKPVCGIPLNAVKNNYAAFMQQVRQQAKAIEEAAKKKASESKTDGSKKGA